MPFLLTTSIACHRYKAETDPSRIVGRDVHTLFPDAPFHRHTFPGPSFSSCVKPSYLTAFQK